MADAVAEADAAAVEEGEEGGVGGDEEALAGVGGGGVALAEGQEVEQLGDGGEAEALRGDFGGQGVVEELDGVVEGADLRGCVVRRARRVGERGARRTPVLVKSSRGVCRAMSPS